MEANKIYQGECLELMRIIESNSIDMILCDLPYGTTKNSWDHCIDPKLLWEAYDHIRKPNAAVVLFGQDKFTASMMLFRQDIHRYNWIWEKGRPSGFLNGNKMPLRSHEDIMVFYDKLPVYHPQTTLGKFNHPRGQRAALQQNNNYGKFNGIDTGKGSGEKLPKSVLYFDKPHPPVHPTQKPIDLLRYLIRTYTNKGALVLDNCIGSGSTAIACVKEDRAFIGIEKNPKYVKLATSRLIAIQQQPELKFE